MTSFVESEANIQWIESLCCLLSAEADSMTDVTNKERRDFVILVVAREQFHSLATSTINQFTKTAVR